MLSLATSRFAVRWTGINVCSASLTSLHGFMCKQVSPTPKSFPRGAEPAAGRAQEGVKGIRGDQRGSGGSGGSGGIGSEADTRDAGSGVTLEGINQGGRGGIRAQGVVRTTATFVSSYLDKNTALCLVS